MSENTLSDYQVVPQQVVAVSKVLSDMWAKLGKPSSPFSKSGEKLVNILIATWEDLFPGESKLWYAERQDYKKDELSISQQIKRHTGRSLASYPMYIYKMMRELFPGFDPAHRNNCLKMVKKWPMFLMANKA